MRPGSLEQAQVHEKGPPSSSPAGSSKNQGSQKRKIDMFADSNDDESDD